MAIARAVIELRSVVRRFGSFDTFLSKNSFCIPTMMSKVGPRYADPVAGKIFICLGLEEC